jgi:hypothetical protein
MQEIFDTPAFAFLSSQPNHLRYGSSSQADQRQQCLSNCPLCSPFLREYASPILNNLKERFQ